ncbi:MAG: hypothetical protein ACRCWM_11160 [Sarcina sp.]
MNDNDKKNPKSVYPPKMRDFAKSYDGEKLISYGTQTFINIPGLGVDPIVVSNISCPEFDYTENLADKDTTK